MDLQYPGFFLSFHLRRRRKHAGAKRKRIFIARPICAAALLYLSVLVPLVSAGPLLGPELDEADGHFLLLSGNVLSKDTTASGYRLLLDRVAFPEKEGQGSSAYNKLARSIRSVWPTRGRVQVLLNSPSEGSSPVTLYGDGSRQQVWVSKNKLVDQSDIYERVRIGQTVLLYGKVSIPQKATCPGQFDADLYNRARDIFMQLTEVRLRGVGNGPIGSGHLVNSNQSQSAASSDATSAGDVSIGPDSSANGNRFQSNATSAPAASAYLNFLADLRYRLKQSALLTFGEKDCALIDAIVLGDRSGLDPETKSLFEDGGILHILAVSSLHVTLLGMTLYKVLRKLRRSFAVSALFSGLLVVSYCLMTGNSFSAIRAAIMFLFWLGSQVAGRTDDRLTALSAAALFILVRQPRAIADTGFLLSFSCILSIELLSPVFTKIFRPKEGILTSLVGSLSLHAGILPLSLWFFYQTTPWAILLNLIVIPSMSLFMAFGVLGCLAGLLPVLTGAAAGTAAGAAASTHAAASSTSSALASSASGLPVPAAILSVIEKGTARAISGPCGILLDLFRLLCKAARLLPGDILITGRPPVWKMVLYYLILSAFCIYVSRLGKKQLLTLKKQLPLIGSALLMGLFLMLCIHRPPAFRYTCLDIGQGSCNLVEQGGTTLLFDAGSSSVNDVYQYRIESTLKYYGISHLDLVFLSHGDIDHISGISQMLKSYHPSLTGGCCGGISIGRILVPDLLEDPEEYSGLSEILSIAKGAGIPLSAVSAGASISPGSGGHSNHVPSFSDRAAGSGMVLRVLSPSPGRLTGETNQDCIVLLLRWQNLRILFTGDLEKEGEENFVKTYQRSSLFSSPEKTKDILIAGHHGSRYATSDQFLLLTKPDLCLISCGKNNRYGHPAPSMLKRLARRRIPYHRTDLSGSYTLKMSGAKSA